MKRRDTLYAALQLQRDASLMSSNLTVLHQYAIVLHRTSTEVLHFVFGRELFHSGAVNDAAPVPRVLRVSTHMAAMDIWRPPRWSGWSRTKYCTPGPGVPGLSPVSSAAVRLVVGACPTGLPPCTGLFWNLK